MKNCLTVICFLILASPLMAQYDPKALEILDAMSKKYKEISAFEANFSYTLTNEVDKINEEFKGKMTVKGDKFRLVLPEQEVINNGLKVWTYLPESKEVNVDNADQGSDEVNPSKIYYVYKKGYKYKMAEEQVDGCDVVDLVPEKRDAQYFQIRMVISKKDRSVVNFTIFDKQSNRFKYTITKFVPNIKVEDSFFTFDPKKYPGVEVIELN